MKRKLMKFAAMGMILTFMMGFMAACSKKGNENSGETSTKSSVMTEKTEEKQSTSSDNEGTSNQSAESTETAGFTYPMEGDVNFTINWGDGVDMYDESAMKEWYAPYNWQKRLKEETGVSLTDVGGKYGTSTPSDEFQLLLASGEYPDIFRANWLSFPGGPNVAMNDGYIIR